LTSLLADVGKELAYKKLISCYKITELKSLGKIYKIKIKVEKLSEKNSESFKGI
jgi:hypothetical protein